MIKPHKQAGKTLTETFPPNWNDLTSDHRIAWINGPSGRLDSANDFPRNWDEKTVMGRAAWVWEFRNRIGNNHDRPTANVQPVFEAVPRHQFVIVIERASGIALALESVWRLPENDSPRRNSDVAPPRNSSPALLVRPNRQNEILG